MRGNVKNIFVRLTQLLKSVCSVCQYMQPQTKSIHAYECSVIRIQCYDIARALHKFVYSCLLVLCHQLSTSNTDAQFTFSTWDVFSLLCVAVTVYVCMTNSLQANREFELLNTHKYTHSRWSLSQHIVDKRSIGIFRFSLHIDHLLYDSVWTTKMS